MNKISLRGLVLCALFMALIAIGAFIRIPVPVVPFTLQYLFTMLAGLLLGGRLGAVSVAGYVLLGLAGVPIFAEGGGPSYVLQPSFGYLLGFILGAYVTGRLSRLWPLTFKKLLAANLLGLFIVYGCGMIYYYAVCNYVINMPITISQLVLYCFILAVPGDICLCIGAAILAKRVLPTVQKMEGFKL